jgi:UDP-N-acetylglucosamine--N-acetylmuramyl-(pentapeptide) pyrophosphoryl-undecaprenol N-acetylglucosamine transferase
VIVIAGGATGGHVMPGLAIARALVRRGHDPRDIHFIGSEWGIEVEAVPAAGFGLTALPGRGLERRLTLRNVLNAWGIVRAVARAVVVMRRMRPRAVVVLGGFASVPGLVGALVWRVPVVASEQNAVPSLATRWAARFAAANAVPAPQGLPREVLTGNPVRDEVAALAGADPAVWKPRQGFPPDRRLLVAFGGSLGSLRINRAVIGLAEQWTGRADLALHHVVGRRDWPELGRPDPPAGGLWYRAVEFDHDLPANLAAADLVVCRSGASTVAELTVIGRPAVLVPGPFAPNDAQSANAAVMASVGAAVVVPDDALDADRLRREVEALLTDGRLAERAEAARRLGRPDAADAVARLVDEHAAPARVADGS